MKKPRHVRGNRKRNRKLHPHPFLIRPKKVIIDNKEVEFEGDNGAIIAGRAYVYHHTKGWRSRRVLHRYDNLTEFMIHYLRRSA